MGRIETIKPSRHTEGRHTASKADSKPDFGLAKNAKPTKKSPPTVAFTRQELAIILNVYGQFVAAGEWRDYAIDCLPDIAVFSIYRRASEAPLYRIEKRPKLANKQGAWLVLAANGTNLRRGHELSNILRVFDKQRLGLAT